MRLPRWLNRNSLVKEKAQTLTTINQGGGWFNIIRESFGGAWQRNTTIDTPKDILAFSAVFACVTIIASDVAKLRIKIVREDENDICTEIKNSPFLPVLKKPNRYQNRIKFVEQWIVSKLLYGNTFALKQRDARGIVVGLYILDAQRVTPLVADSGDIYYQLSADHLSGLQDAVTVPASEIIHDTMVSLWHPLIGVSPIYACGASATMGNKIQGNSTKFFDNMSRPSGMLTAPGSISDEVAARLKQAWEENFSGNNIGRLAVLGDALKYEAMTIPAQEAQLIEQLKWTVEDVARCFHVPLYKLGGPVPLNNTIENLNQGYYSDCLQSMIESFEMCLDWGLDLPEDYYTEFDLEGLIRMDQSAQMDVLERSVKGSIRKINEARQKLNLKPVDGGDTIYMQQQNYSLEALTKRDAMEDPFNTAKQAALEPIPEPNKELEKAIEDAAIATKALEELKAKAEREAIEKAEKAALEMATFAELVIKGLEYEHTTA